MTSALYPQSFIFRAFTQSGTLAPLAGGLLYFYQAGTTTLQAAYSDPTGATPLSNPLVLDSNGVASFCLLSGLKYKITLTDSLGVVQDGYPIDNIVADPSVLVGASRYGIDTGAVNAYVVALTPPVTSNYNGLRITFKAANTNTGASTFDSGAGPINVVGYSGLPLAAGNIIAGGIYDIIYDSATSQFRFTTIFSNEFYAVDTGAVNAYAISVGTANVPGLWVAFKAANSNSGASTLNIGGGAAPLVDNAGNALVAGGILAGKIYQAFYDGVTSKWWLASQNPSVLHQTVFTSSGTWTCPSYVNWVDVTAVGGGGGGSGGSTGPTGGGGGGGGGGATIKRRVPVTPNTVYTVTIGSAGSGAGAGLAGGNGTDTTFGSLVRAKAGSGGSATTTTSGGVGGLAGTGSLVGIGGTVDPVLTSTTIPIINGSGAAVAGGPGGTGGVGSTTGGPGAPGTGIETYAGGAGGSGDGGTLGGGGGGGATAYGAGGAGGAWNGVSSSPIATAYGAGGGGGGRNLVGAAGMTGYCFIEYVG